MKVKYQNIIVFYVIIELHYINKCRNLFSTYEVNTGSKFYWGLMIQCFIVFGKEGFYYIISI